MEKEYKMSAARAQELQEELNYLKTTRSDEVAEQIKVARGFGDLSENSEYDEAKNEQGKLYSRIAELEEIVQHLVIVDESSMGTDVVAIGCKVTVEDASGKELPPLLDRRFSGGRPHARCDLRGISLRQGPAGRQGRGRRHGGSTPGRY